MAWARAWAGARAWAWARAGARAWAGAGARGRCKRPVDPVWVCMAYDKAYEEGETVWSDIEIGKCVLIECPQRWYCGVVLSRTSLTVRLSPALIGHTLGDLGQFLAGKLAEAELTPAPRPIEVSLAAVETAQEYPLEYFEQINKRTHKEIAAR